MKMRKRILSAIGLMILGAIITLGVVQQGRYSNQTYNQNFEMLDVDQE